MDKGVAVQGFMGGGRRGWVARARRRHVRCGLRMARGRKGGVGEGVAGTRRRVSELGSNSGLPCGKYKRLPRRVGGRGNAHVAQARRRYVRRGGAREGREEGGGQERGLDGLRPDSAGRGGGGRKARARTHACARARTHAQTRARARARARSGVRGVREGR